MNRLIYPILFILLFTSIANAQKSKAYNLQTLLKNGGIITAKPQSISALNDGDKTGVACKSGVYWLKDVNFTSGTIDVDIKGRNVLQQSFVGIAFHGVDSINTDIVYLRPFNFRSTDTLRKQHAVQYVSQPDYTWEKLREEHPLMYEQPVATNLEPNGWVHVHIVVKGDAITVYLNNSPKQALKVKKLGSRADGMLGLWCFGSEEADFANLVVKKN